jgi:inner membrane transporter RhtA
MSFLRNHTILPFLAVLGSVTFLGIGTSWAKISLFPLVGAEGTTALRIGFSALMLCLFFRPWQKLPSRPDLKRIAIYGAALGAMNLAFYMALQTLPFGVAVAIEFSGPLAVAIASSRRPLDFVWVLLAIGGLGLLLPVGHAPHALDPLGIGFALTAAAFWAAYIVFGKRVGHLPAGNTVALGAVVAALLAIPVGAAHAGTLLLSPGLLIIGLGVAVLSSAIPISLEMMALQRLPKQAFGIMISMEPAVAALLAFGLLNESLSATQWAAIGMIMGASVGIALSTQRDG